MEEGIQQLLTTTPAIAALIAARMYPILLPDGETLDSVAYQLISNVEENTNDGPTGFNTARVQIGAWSQRLANAKAISSAIRAVLNGYQGTLPNGTYVVNAWRDGLSSRFEPISRLYHVDTDWMIQYSGSAAEPHNPDVSTRPYLWRGGPLCT